MPLKLCYYEEKKRSSQKFGIANAPESRLATDTLEQIWNQKELRANLNGILRAIAKGHSCEQILDSDRTLSYRHIFHAVAEAPTTFWDKTPAEHTSNEAPREPAARRTPAKQRA